MVINRVRVTNYKTYQNLDLDLSVQDGRPIILIGGNNGGGKTTLFDAIYGTLYGLNIRNKKEFEDLLNDGARGIVEPKITLELDFQGMVLGRIQQYQLKRSYILNPSEKPVESVSLNMDGATFVYGTATPPAQRVKCEQQVNKIIKANLPQELSNYFLFDAMKAGDMIRNDVFSKTIKDNIENVMGFDKYVKLHNAAEKRQQEMAAAKIEAENQRQEYEELCSKKEEKEKRIEEIDADLDTLYKQTASMKDDYDRAKSGAATAEETKRRIDGIKTRIRDIQGRAAEYHDTVDSFVSNIEINVFFPHLASDMNLLLNTILREKESLHKDGVDSLSEETIRKITSLVVDYLQETSLCSDTVTAEAVADYLISKTKDVQGEDKYDYLDSDDLSAIRRLLGIREDNNFPAIQKEKHSLDVEYAEIPALEQQKKALELSEIDGNFLQLISTYEASQSKITSLEKEKTDIKVEIGELEKQIHRYDIQVQQIPDVKFDTLTRLVPFFQDVTDALLKKKKSFIEEEMKQQLNIMLSSYKDNIDRVELSDSMENFTIRMYHKSGNEISMNHLNAASKQIFIQVLLSVLRGLGDYDPPVMIDTVMGVLDEESREIMMEEYFPKLGNQVILLCTTSEIRPEIDLKKLSAFTSKSYTLKRNPALQKTDVEDGYFGKHMED